MASKGQFRAAVVGTGFIGEVHIDALRRLGVDVAGVVGSSQSRAAEKAAATGVPVAYGSLTEMLADTSIDVVHVASPSGLHFDQVKAVLGAGKHCVCEKPLALTSEQTGELLSIAEGSGLVHATNFNIRFYPQVQEACARVASGALGAPWLVHGGYIQDWLLLNTDWNWRLDPAVGGRLRAVGDIGSHWIDLITFIVGQRVESVMADLSTFIPVRRRPMVASETFGHKHASGSSTEEVVMESEDAAGLLLRFEGGARAIVTISQVSAGRRNHLHFQVDGQRSALGWNSERPEELWIGHREWPNQLLMRDPALLGPTAAAVTAMPGGHAEGFADTFRELYRAVYRAVAAGGPPETPDYPTFRDGHEAAVIGDAVARSAREQRWVHISQSSVGAGDAR